MSADIIADLVVVYKGAVPRDLMASDIGVDIANVIAEVLVRANSEVERLSAGAHLSTATGLFLDVHARDRGLRRQDGETDDMLRARLRKPPLAGTVPAIMEALEAIVGENNVIIVELPRHSMYFDREMCMDRGIRAGGGRGVVIALIPASADAVSAVSDALRSKVSAGKIWLVEEYTV